jgi:hypothetical protein
MSAMNQSLGAFRAALVAGWVVLGAAGWWLARDKGIPNWAALPVLAAFLVEYPFYLAAGFSGLRERFAGTRLPFWLAVSAVLPYLVSCWGTGAFAWAGLAKLLALVLALALWYVVLPASALTDIGFLGLVAAVMIGKYFNAIYVPAYPGLEVAILGHLALIHTSAMVLLLERRLDPAGFGFWPGRVEWREGFLHYLYFLPLGFPIGLALGAIRFGPMPPAWRIVGTFFGILWVVALSEELFFRGGAAAVDRSVDGAALGRAGGGVAAVRVGAPAVPGVSQLAIRGGGGGGGFFLRARVQPDGEHTGGDGDARAGGDDVADAVRVRVQGRVPAPRTGPRRGGLWGAARIPYNLRLWPNWDFSD